MNGYQMAFAVLVAFAVLLVRAATTRRRDESFAEAFRVTFAIALAWLGTL